MDATTFLAVTLACAPQVHSDTARALLNADAPLPKVLSVKMWTRAIPQYDM